MGEDAHHAWTTCVCCMVCLMLVHIGLNVSHFPACLVKVLPGEPQIARKFVNIYKQLQYVLDSFAS